jgi:hypothetical protein
MVMMADWELRRWRRLVAERANVAANLAAHQRQGDPDLPRTPLLIEAIAAGRARLEQLDRQLAALDQAAG